MLDHLLSLVAPHSCSGCGEVGSLLCGSCKNDIVDEPYGRCIFCEKAAKTNICTTCRKKHGVEDVWCVGERSHGLKNLVDAYKFRSSKEASKHISELLDLSLPIMPLNTVVVPVPTAPSHKRIRGFGHTEFFAKSLAKKRGLLCRHVLSRVTSDTQHFKKRPERLNEIKKSFEVIAAVPEVILLVDDIITTGATLSSCTKRLRAAGAKHIYIGVVARQPSK